MIMRSNYEYSLTPHKLRFIGKDKSMGLRRGKIYDVFLYSGLKYYWVVWDKNDANSRCSYETLDSLRTNWEDVIYSEVKPYRLEGVDDLKEGMIFTLDDGRKGVLLTDEGCYVRRENIKFVNNEFVLSNYGHKVTRIEYGDEVLWKASKKVTKMTPEKMKEKLEELTGEEIEVTGEKRKNRAEMLNTCRTYCLYTGCKKCILGKEKLCHNRYKGTLEKFELKPLEDLEECHKKIMDIYENQWYL